MSVHPYVDGIRKLTFEEESLLALLLLGGLEKSAVGPSSSAVLEDLRRIRPLGLVKVDRGAWHLTRAGLDCTSHRHIGRMPGPLVPMIAVKLDHPLLRLESLERSPLPPAWDPDELRRIARK